MSNDRKCPAACGNNIETGHVLCWACWWALPQQRRVEVNATRHAFLKIEHRTVQDRINASMAYGRAKSEAIEAARERVIRKKVSP